MAFQYHDIKTASIVPNEIFIFDANIWIANHYQIAPKSFQRPYLRFLDRLLREPNDPVVLLPAAVLSEVVNRLLKDDYFDNFMKSEAGKKKLIGATMDPKEHFKELYRPDPQYYKDRNVIYDEIFSFSSNLSLISDDFDLIKLSDLSTALTDLDFTDWIIYKLAIAHEATIITTDGDFVVENQPIITNNPKLLSLK